MKIFKRILIVLAILVAVAAIAGFFLPADMHVERSTTIQVPPGRLYSYLDNLKNEVQWSPWHEKDSTTQYTYEGPETGVGSKVSWKSNNSDVGNGYQVTVEAEPGQRIKRELHFMEENGRPAFGTYTLVADGDGTRITWALDANMGSNPFMHLLGAVMQGAVVKDFDRGLANMKSRAESLPAAPELNFRIETTSLPGTFYLFVHDTASAETIGQKLGQHFAEVSRAAAKQKLNITGPPFAIYYTDSKTNWELDAGVPVESMGKADGNVQAGERKAGNAVVAHYFGAYESMVPVYTALQAYIASEKKTISGPPWEVYITDPMAEKDTAKWATDVCFPVE
jgi:effector-binding domain-containing protein/uncharacterized protein YndB with AHSA1/START domain